MLETIAIVLLLLWVVGLVSSYTLSTLQGTPLASWLPIQNTPRLQACLSQVLQTQTHQNLGLTLAVRGRAEQTVCAAACTNPLAPGFLIVWVDAPLTE